MLVERGEWVERCGGSGWRGVEREGSGWRGVEGGEWVERCGGRAVGGEEGVGGKVWREGSGGEVWREGSGPQEDGMVSMALLVLQ